MMRRRRLTSGESICVTSKFVFLPGFDRAVKHLKKQYRNIVTDLESAFELIEADPEVGSVIPRDYAVRKLRVSSRDMQRGKSGGFRILYKVENREGETRLIYLLLVYAKTEQTDVSLKQLQDLVQALEDLLDQ